MRSFLVGGVEMKYKKVEDISSLSLFPLPPPPPPHIHLCKVGGMDERKEEVLKKIYILLTIVIDLYKKWRMSVCDSWQQQQLHSPRLVGQMTRLCPDSSLVI